MAKKELLKSEQEQQQQAQLPAIDNTEAGQFFAFYANSYRVANWLCQSDLLPMSYQNKPANCMIAINMAHRINADPMMIMQNLYMVHGKPSWSSQFLISCINASGRFSPLRYKMTGEENTDSWGCVAWAKDNTGEILESPKVTIAMAKREGWYNKTGSKWQTMPELMLHYRAATFFARLYAPELTMGLQTREEVIDAEVVDTPKTSRFENAKPVDEAKPEKETETEPSNENTDMEKLTALIAERRIPVTAEQVKMFVESNGELFSYAMVAPAIDQIAETIINLEK